MFDWLMHDGLLMGAYALGFYALYQVSGRKWQRALLIYLIALVVAFVIGGWLWWVLYMVPYSVILGLVRGSPAVCVQDRFGQWVC